MGDTGKKFYQIGVYGLICVHLGAPEMKSFENYCHGKSPSLTLRCDNKTDFKLNKIVHPWSVSQNLEQPFCSDWTPF